MLCEQTAIFGVLKQADKATGEMIEHMIKFNKASLPCDSDSDDVSNSFIDGADNARPVLS